MTPLPRLLPGRREFLLQAGGGFGAIALAAMLRAEESSRPGQEPPPIHSLPARRTSRPARNE